MILITLIILADCEHRKFVLFIFVILGATTDLGFSGGYWPTLLYFAPSFAGMISGLANSIAHISGFLSSHVVDKLVKTVRLWDSTHINLKVKLIVFLF